MKVKIPNVLKLKVIRNRFFLLHLAPVGANFEPDLTLTYFRGVRVMGLQEIQKAVRPTEVLLEYKDIAELFEEILR